MKSWTTSRIGSSVNNAKSAPFSRRTLSFFGCGGFVHDGAELLAGHVLMLQQELGDGIQLVPVDGQQLQGLLVGAVDDLLPMKSWKASQAVPLFPIV